MDYLQQLLNNQPVEWKKLGEVCDVLRGKRLTKSQLSQENNGYAVYHGGIVPIGYYHSPNRNADSTMVINVGASAGTVGYSKEKFWSSDGCFCFSDSPILLQRFLFYYLQSIEHKIKSKVRVAGIPTLDASVLSKLPLPIPPLSVQSRIVEILDKFTAMEAELQAELELRKKQYAYYREQLLNFSYTPPSEFNVVYRKLGEVCTKVCSGGTPSTSNPEYYKGNIPWLRTQDVDWKDVYDTDIKITEEAIKYSSAQWIPANCVIVAMYGATAAKACINRIPLTTNQACCNLQVDENIANYKYVYHWICREYERLRALGEGSQSNLSSKKIKDYKIPIPPLSEQARIVEILDKFDTLTNSISEGLPLEIQLRRQQYEYYREQLLDFRN